MVLKGTLISNFRMNIVTKFQVSIFKNYEVRGGGEETSPQTWNKLDRRQRGIGLRSLSLFIQSNNYSFSWFNDLRQSEKKGWNFSQLWNPYSCFSVKFLVEINQSFSGYKDDLKLIYNNALLKQLNKLIKLWIK